MANSTRYVLKWTNIFSGESGYVASVRKSKGYFENSWELDGAKTYISESLAKRDIDTLVELGEAENNRFEIIEK